jgi:hypothetical protein
MLMSVGVRSKDAANLAKEFQSKFDVEDLRCFPNCSLYLKLMINGAPSHSLGANVLRRR